MKVLLDTSTLIASMVESHTKHGLALSWLKMSLNKELETFVSAHSILEIYSVLTTAPFKPKISPEIAKKLIDVNVKNNCKIVSLSSNDYFNLIHILSTNNFKGGVVFDALIYECAKKEKVDKIITANAKDFLRVNTSKSIEIVAL